MLRYLSVSPSKKLLSSSVNWQTHSSFSPVSRFSFCDLDKIGESPKRRNSRNNSLKTGPYVQASIFALTRGSEYFAKYHPCKKYTILFMSMLVTARPASSAHSKTKLATARTSYV